MPRYDFVGHNATGLQLGADGNPNWQFSGYFKGLIDDVRIYGEALTAPEIQAIIIPEPSTLLLGIFGVAGSVFVRRPPRTMSEGCRAASPRESVDPTVCRICTRTC